MKLAEDCDQRTFSIGDKVRLITKDCNFAGFVIMKGTKRDGVSVRYVVENQDGILHIYSGKNLEKI